MKKIFLTSLIIFAGIGLNACQTLKTTSAVTQAVVTPSAIKPVNWKLILPPPPDNAVEITKVIEAQGSHSGARWDKAEFDNKFEPFAMYQQILGSDFTAQNNPDIAAVFAYSLKAHFKLSSDAKKAYDRVRPLYYDKQNVLFCAKGDEPSGSSYPSGHSAWGWETALILSRIYPDKADELIARGREYGESRVVCGAHYPSDVNYGRVTGDVIFTRLQNDKEFRDLMAKVKIRQ
jgi:acid phosphatase (class A)